ncbi:MAG TPA: MOSC domain-containing protein [Actinomycetota bacterium]|nr:MOSC domain-containing protein [Actinomycetota bacterium]
MRVVSVNVGRPQTYSWCGEEITTSIFKTPVEGRVAVRELGVDGDEQANKRVHGGPYKAVYAYALEELRRLGKMTGHDLAPAGVGENLTLEGVAVRSAEVGERWRVGTACVQVTMPRSPCTKIELRTGDPSFRRKFADARLFGAYLRVIEEGEVAAGDPVEILHRPGHGLTVTKVFEIATGPRERAAELLVAGDALPPHLRELAERRST